MPRLFKPLYILNSSCTVTSTTPPKIPCSTTTRQFVHRSCDSEKNTIQQTGWAQWSLNSKLVLRRRWKRRPVWNLPPQNRTAMVASAGRLRRRSLGSTRRDGGIISGEAHRTDTLYSWMCSLILTFAQGFHICEALGFPPHDCCSAGGHGFWCGECCFLCIGGYERLDEIWIVSFKR